MRGDDSSRGAEAVVPACLLLLAGLGACFSSGCGSAAYEDRLEESKNYFAYVQKLNANLSSPWSERPVNAYRVPRDFRPIPGPAPDAVEGGYDPRQPDYMSVQLPGLLGAWQSQASVGSDEGSESVLSYLYVLSNYDYFTLTDTEERRAAATFNDDLISLVAQGMGVPRPEESTWNELRVPIGDVYVETKTFDEVPIKTNESLIGLPTQASLYLYQTGDIQVAILFITPHGPDADSINLSLETLEVSSQTPQGSAGRGGDAPRGGGSTSF